MMRSTLLPVLAAALVALSAPAAPASESYVGEQVDPVSGYPCVTPFCDVVRIPGTDCLCTKSNPSEQRRARLELVCTDMRTRQSCPITPR